MHLKCRYFLFIKILGMECCCHILSFGANYIKGISLPLYWCLPHKRQSYWCLYNNYAYSFWHCTHKPLLVVPQGLWMQSRDGTWSAISKTSTLLLVHPSAWHTFSTHLTYSLAQVFLQCTLSLRHAPNALFQSQLCPLQATPQPELRTFLPLFCFIKFTYLVVWCSLEVSEKTV